MTTIIFWGLIAFIVPTRASTGNVGEVRAVFVKAPLHNAVLAIPDGDYVAANTSAPPDEMDTETGRWLWDLEDVVLSFPNVSDGTTLDASNPIVTRLVDLQMASDKAELKDGNNGAWESPSRFDMKAGMLSAGPLIKAKTGLQEWNYKTSKDEKQTKQNISDSVIWSQINSNVIQFARRGELPLKIEVKPGANICVYNNSYDSGVHGKPIMHFKHVYTTLLKNRNKEDQQYLPVDTKAPPSLAKTSTKKGAGNKKGKVPAPASSSDLGPFNRKPDLCPPLVLFKSP